jgi:hypothetical protein
MLLTEEEAKTKWCPFARPVVAETLKALIVPQGRTLEYKTDGMLTTVDQSCIASACMAWRWATDGEAWAAANPHPRQPDPLGYCGIAGKPE